MLRFHLPKGWIRLYSHHCDALDKAFFPVWDKPGMHSEKVRATQCILPLVPSLSFTRHWYAVICASRLGYIGFVSISLKDEGACCLKRHSACQSKLVRRPYDLAFQWRGSVVMWELLIQTRLSVSKSVNKESKMALVPKHDVTTSIL